MIKRPRMSRMSVSLGTSGAMVLFTVLMTPSAPAKATRPVIRPPSLIKGLSSAQPIKFEEALNSDILGIDQESEARRKTLLSQAKAYVDMRSGKTGRGGVAKWLASCLQAIGDKVPEDKTDPFCKYDVDRRQNGGSTRGKRGTRAIAKLLAKDLSDGKFESANERAWSDVVSAASVLENTDRLMKVAEKVAATSTCVATKIPAALGFKLEEKFPAPEVVALAEKLYEKASGCANDYGGAHSSYRLALMKLWRQSCDGVTELMQRVESNREASQFYARAKYWRHYCAQQKGDAKSADLAKASLIKDHPMSFQALAVAGENDAHINAILDRETPSVAFRSVVRDDLNPLIRATEALVKIDAKMLAAEVIDKSVREFGSMEPETRLYLAALLNRIGYALPKFKILAELFQDAPRMVTRTTLKLFFPLWYYDEVKNATDHVDPLLILSLIRQESAFDKTARSSVGARGLMQVMPATARTVARVKTDRLFDPKTNIGVGTKYLSKRLEQYSGDVELTLAAYNAGFMRVEQWKKRYPTDNRFLFFDLIPFRETREYVSSILRNYYWYVKLYGKPASDETASADARLVSNQTSKITAIASGHSGLAAMETTISPTAPGPATASDAQAK